MTRDTAALAAAIRTADLGRGSLQPMWASAEWVLTNSARMDAARAKFAERNARD